jgi:hypothetical protein
MGVGWCEWVEKSNSVGEGFALGGVFFFFLKETKHILFIYIKPWELT